VNLPAAALGHSVRLLWRLGTDDNNATCGDPGECSNWFIDDIQLTPSCAPSGGTLVCGLGDIPAGGVVNLTITGTVAPGHPILLVNRVRVTSGGVDPDPSNNYDSEATCAASDNPFCAHATLSGASEVPPTGSPATGAVRIATEAMKICWAVQVHGLQGTPTAAHIHTGAAGVNGPIALDLGPPDPVTGLSTGCLDADPLAANIRADEAGFYVNAHSTAFPGGEIRGQLAEG
jgi:hypothetical protein